jgi:hypothetical protein
MSGSSACFRPFDVDRARCAADEPSHIHIARPSRRDVSLEMAIPAVDRAREDDTEVA